MPSFLKKIHQEMCAEKGWNFLSMYYEKIYSFHIWKVNIMSRVSHCRSSWCLNMQLNEYK